MTYDESPQPNPITFVGRWTVPCVWEMKTYVTHILTHYWNAALNFFIKKLRMDMPLHCIRKGTHLIMLLLFVCMSNAILLCMSSSVSINQLSQPREGLTVVSVPTSKCQNLTSLVKWSSNRNWYFSPPSPPPLGKNYKCRLQCPIYFACTPFFVVSMLQI